MASYSTSEKLIATVLNRTPFIKRFLKKAYQTLNYLVNKKKETFSCYFPIKRIGNPEKETFFGYYDKSPINESEQYLIFQETTHSTRKKPNKNTAIFIVLFDIRNNKEIHRWETFAYNWQQGSNLLWISEFKFIFNFFDIKKQKYASKIIDVNNIELDTVINHPIYDAHSKFGLNLSFERLNNIMPDYGYRNHKTLDKFDYEKEGVLKIDLENNEHKLIISIQDIINLHHKKSMDNATHWFNHIMISPNGKQFMFLHRWIKNGKKEDALILANIDGTELECLADDGMVSHCFWKNDEEIISYMRTEATGNKYYIINTIRKSIEIIGEEIINIYGDGHPNVFDNNIIFDTYPNRARMKELFKYDIKTNELIKLGEFFESLKFNEETRCDLHPKYSSDGKSVFIDSVHEGKRGLYQIILEK